MWWAVLICDLIIPVIITIAGLLMWKIPPKNVNYVMGYRTKLSMKNIDTWKFAQKHMGGLWWKLGLIMLVVTIGVHIPFHNSGENTLEILCLIVTAVQIIALIVSIFFTERALKKTFNDDGTRK
ncbi:MAG: SdpI family protein [Clostridia bacterium]|nr:SdpI family protein [Clostridia bacterium]